MSLSQLASIKRWLLLHPSGHGVELFAWNLVLTGWLMGWAGLPGTLLVGEWTALPLCCAASVGPRFYVMARRRLHRSGRLRCDWLTAL